MCCEREIPRRCSAVANPPRVEHARRAHGQRQPEKLLRDFISNVDELRNPNVARPCVPARVLGLVRFGSAERGTHPASSAKKNRSLVSRKLAVESELTRSLVRHGLVQSALAEFALLKTDT